ncbi:hypothetical protein AOLI_G00121280 [Acnodon oligacanthus]
MLQHDKHIKGISLTFMRCIESTSVRYGQSAWPNVLWWTNTELDQRIWRRPVAWSALLLTELQLVVFQHD